MNRAHFYHLLDICQQFICSPLRNATQDVNLVNCASLCSKLLKGKCRGTELNRRSGMLFGSLTICRTSADVISCNKGVSFSY
jgi:hypothetical protein